MEEDLKEKIEQEFKEQGVDDVNVKVSQFLGHPWLYILFYHKGRGVIFDMSVKTYKHYGIMLDLLKNQWMKIHKQEW